MDRCTTFFLTQLTFYLLTLLNDNHIDLSSQSLLTPAIYSGMLLQLYQLYFVTNFSYPSRGWVKIYHIFLYTFELIPLYNGLWDPF